MAMLVEKLSRRCLAVVLRCHQPGRLRQAHLRRLRLLVVRLVKRRRTVLTIFAAVCLILVLVASKQQAQLLVKHRASLKIFYADRPQ